MRLQTLFDNLNRELFTIHSKEDYPSILRQIEALAIEVHNTVDEEDEWIYMGEGCEACIPDIFVGAYWHLTEWHGGQSSDSYRVMCRIGEVFSPGMTSGPEEDSSEEYVYQRLNELAEKQSKAA